MSSFKFSSWRKSWVILLSL